MKMRLLFLLIFILIIASVVYWWRVVSYGYEKPAASTAVVEQGVDNPIQQSLVFGILTSDPGAEGAEAFFQSLQPALEGTDIADVEVVSFDTVVDAARAMRQGRIDIFFGPSFGAYEVAKLGGGDALLERVQPDAAQSVFYAPVSAGLTNDLAGLTVAVGDTHSSLLYLLPLAELRAQGFNVVDSGDTSANSRSVKFVTKASVSDIEEDVISGAADAGVATDGDVPQPGSTRFIELLSTRRISGELLTFSDRISEEQRQVIMDTFTTADDTSEGRLILSNFGATKEVRVGEQGEEWDNTVYLSSLVEREILH